MVGRSIQIQHASQRCSVRSLLGGHGRGRCHQSTIERMLLKPQNSDSSDAMCARARARRISAGSSSGTGLMKSFNTPGHPSHVNYSTPQPTTTGSRMSTCLMPRTQAGKGRRGMREADVFAAKALATLAAARADVVLVAWPRSETMCDD